MKNPYMLISGVMVIGFLIPEILAIWKLKIPPAFNLIFSIGCGLVAGAFVL